MVFDLQKSVLFLIAEFICLSIWRMCVTFVVYVFIIGQRGDNTTHPVPVCQVSQLGDVKEGVILFKWFGVILC